MGRKVELAVLIAATIALLVWLALREEPAPAPPPRTATPAPVAAEPPRHEKEAPRARAKPVEETPPAADAATPATPTTPPPPPTTGPTLTGRVVDADGRPVAGARVVSHPDELRKAAELAKAGAEGSRSFVGTSDADGRFAVPIDPKGVQLILTASADAGIGQAAAGPKDRDVEIRLAAWMTLSGRVTNTASEPVGGARVTLHLLLDALTVDRTAVADANGEYRIERVSPFPWAPSSNAPWVGRGTHGWVVAEADGYAPLLVDRSSMGGQRAGDDPAKLDLVLVRGMTVSGKVVDGDTKAGIAGATVIVWSVEAMGAFGSAAGTTISNPWGQRTLGEVKSAEDGSFRFEHLPAKGPSGIASHNSGKRGMTLGHVAAWKDGYVYGGDEVPVSKDGTVFETTIELWPSATITGRVVDPAGAPVDDAVVSAYVDERRPALNGFAPEFRDAAGYDVRTDGDGRYRVATFRASRAGPTTGKLAAFKTAAGSSARSNLADVTATAGATIEAPDLVIDFGAIPRAVFIVTDERGAPVPGAVIGSMQPKRTDLDGRAMWSPPWSPPRTETPIRAETVVVRARGFAPRQVEFTPARGTPADVPVVLKGGLRLTGRVQRADGTPAAKVSVVVADGTKSYEEVFGDGSQPRGAFEANSKRLLTYANAATAADGTFAAADLPEGPYLVVAETASRAPVGTNRMPKMLRDVRAGVATGAQDLVLTIPADDAPPTQALDLVVTDAAGGAVEKCYAWAVVGGLRFAAQAAGPIKLRFAALPAGRATIEVSAEGWAGTTLRDVEIPPGAAPAPISVRLGRGITVRGVVRAASGALPDGAVLVFAPLARSALAAMPRVELRKDGSFELTGFLPGRYRPAVHDPAPREIATALIPAGDGVLTVPEGGRDVVVDLVVVRCGAISVTVRDTRLPPPPFGGGQVDADKERFGAASHIDVIDAAGAIVSSLTTVWADSRLNSTVAPGDYTVRLVLAGEPPQEQRCTVEAGAEASVYFPAK